jgi:hypothetical protein
MKTPIQELIDRLDYLIDLSNETMYEFGLKVAKKEAESMLEKEKEMIMDEPSKPIRTNAVRN